MHCNRLQYVPVCPINQCYEIVSIYKLASFNIQFSVFNHQVFLVSFLSLWFYVSADFKINVMTLDDLAPARLEFNAETPRKQVGNDRN